MTRFVCSIHDKRILAKLNQRAFDSEVKGLEDILNKTTPDSSGNIKIISDRNMCPPCTQAIKQFKKMRPGIKVEKVYVREYP